MDLFGRKSVGVFLRRPIGFRVGTLAANQHYGR